MFFIDFFEKLITCNVTKNENNNINLSSNECFESYLSNLKDCCDIKKCCGNKKYKKNIITNMSNNLNKEKNLDNIYHSSKEEKINDIKNELEEKMIFKQKKINNYRIPC